MEVFLLVVFLVASILLLIMGVTIEGNQAGFILGMCFIVFSVCTTSFACRILNKNEKKLTPIEVYRGNTTLQITYRDSIPVDSVVVWKK